MRAFSALLTLIAVGGCGTFTNLPCGHRVFFDTHYLRPFGGVMNSFDRGIECCSAGHPLAGAYLFGIDLPLSAVADTITLPRTIYGWQTGETPWAPPPMCE